MPDEDAALKECRQDRAMSISRSKPTGRLAVLAVAPLLAALYGCSGGSGGGASTPVVGASAPIVTVAPASSSLTTAQTLSVSVTVSASGTAPPPDGAVILTSGGFTTGAATLSAGKATISVPAGVLAVGADALNVQYTPSAAAAASYTAAAGSVSVTVGDAQAPTVTAQSSPVPTLGHPFQALALGANVLVSVTQNMDAGSQTGVRVFSAASPTQLNYTCTQVASHPNHMGAPVALGLTALPNGLDLALAIDDAGVDFLNRPATLGCASGEIVVSQGDLSTAQGTFGVAITPDGKYAFVANEYGVVAKDSTGANIQGDVGVVALSYDATGHVSGGRLVGQISTGGQAIANVTLSPDGTRLYVTSEIVDPGAAVSGTGNSVLAHTGCVQSAPDAGGNVTTSPYGLLSVIDVGKAETTPNASAIIATVASGCSPVRVVETADQQVIWVAARGDNRVLAFSTRTLETNPGGALLGYGDTGGFAPVGLQLFHGGQILAVANSNRFSSPPTGNMTLMNAVPVHPTVLQTVPARDFPRSVSVAPDDSTLYLTDYDSAVLQVISTVVK